ncbi:nucleotidyltransferase domain-containing protein [Rossellomorea aquimaris]|uniref:nucleotidyltransferase domain-containing protein n=1 Tax=Rossellomorea aquimaris TaxID=189382 RepID=UPI0007D0813C|nr:nucleotidyltransferase domain-containing protein [Rossellomorea aquimaris]
MKKRILEELSEMEKEENVKVIYAVEAGSRAWGYHTDTSDFDVRFIYISQVHSYLSLQKSRNVIEKPFHSKLEMRGWDLTKALKLLHNSNSSILEWLTEENVYIEHPIIKKIRALGEATFSIKTCLIHYRQMAKRNMNLQKKEDFVEVKKYMNILRPWLACNWIVKFKTFPPNNIYLLLNQVMMNAETRLEIERILKLRKNDRNFMPYAFFAEVTEYIESELIKIDCNIKELKNPPKNLGEAIDDLFLVSLKEVWKINF